MTGMTPPPALPQPPSPSSEEPLTERDVIDVPVSRPMLVRAPGSKESVDSVADFFNENTPEEPDYMVAFNRRLEELTVRPVITATAHRKVPEGPLHFQREPFDTAAATELFQQLGTTLVLVNGH